MQWQHKGIEFRIEIEELGSFFLASARVPGQGPFQRVRPFSSLGRSREQALELLQEQIRFEYRKVPVIATG